MDTITSYKSHAFASLDNQWTSPVLCTLTYLLIAFAANVVIELVNDSELTQSVLNIILTLALLPLSWSFTTLFLDFTREGQTSIGALFHGYRKPWLPKSFLLPLLVGIYTFLWTLLLIIPGFIKSYAYAMAYYIYKDHREMGCNKAIGESIRLMDGHKWQLFVLDLSFLGWLLLSILTLGIGLLWLIPYWSTARAHFYEDLIREKNAEVQSA